MILPINLEDLIYVFCSFDSRVFVDAVVSYLKRTAMKELMARRKYTSFEEAVDGGAESKTISE